MFCTNTWVLPRISWSSLSFPNSSGRNESGKKRVRSRAVKKSGGWPSEQTTLSRQTSCPTVAPRVVHITVRYSGGRSRIVTLAFAMIENKYKVSTSLSINSDLKRRPNDASVWGKSWIGETVGPVGWTACDCFKRTNATGSWAGGWACGWVGGRVGGAGEPAVAAGWPESLRLMPGSTLMIQEAAALKPGPPRRYA